MYSQSKWKCQTTRETLEDNNTQDKEWRLLLDFANAAEEAEVEIAKAIKLSMDATKNIKMTPIEALVWKEADKAKGVKKQIPNSGLLVLRDRDFQSFKETKSRI